MLKAQVKIGATYRVRVGLAITDVRITATRFPRGWTGINLRTGREVGIRSAAKLRMEVQAAPAPAPAAMDYKTRASGEREGD